MVLYTAVCLTAIARIVAGEPRELTSLVTSWPSQTYVTEGFTAPRAAISKLGPTSPGYLFFNIGGAGARTTNAIIMTEDGQLVWRPERQRIAATNFGVQTYKGQDVLTFFESNPDIGNTGQFRVLNQSYDEIHNVCGAELNITTESRFPCKINLHETRISHRSTLLATGHDIRRADLSSVGGPKDGWVVDNVVFEIDIETEEVLFSWSHLDHIDELPLSHSYNLISHPNLGQGHDGSSRNAPYDFTHINSVHLVGDDYLISSRYYWTAIMVDKKGRLKWYLDGLTGGNFTLPIDCRFSFQHDIVARHVDSTSMIISMFDNAQDQAIRPTKPSSGLELLLNFTDYSVSLVRRLMDPEVFIATQLTGGYQTLPHGHALANFAIPCFLREFDEDGNVVYAAQLGTVGRCDIYRAYKQKWIGLPSTEPKVVAKVDKKSGQTRVWVSWNGATEVAHWAFYANNRSDVLLWQEQVPKEYFETSVKLTGEVEYVQVKALDAGGSGLGQSAVIAVKGASVPEPLGLAQAQQIPLFSEDYEPDWLE